MTRISASATLRRLGAPLAGASLCAAVLAAPAAAQDRASRPDVFGGYRGTARLTSSATAAPSVDARSTLGLTLSLSGNDRDTLGVLVSGLVADGPADRSGIEEGNRVSEINGVDLRADPGASARDGELVLRRLSRELRNVRPGDDVDLRIYAAGRRRSVTLRAASAPAVALSSSDDDAPPARLSDAPRGGDAPTLASVIASLGDLQAQLRRLEQNGRAGASADALTDAEVQLADLRRRLRDAQGTTTERSSLAGGAGDELAPAPRRPYVGTITSEDGPPARRPVAQRDAGTSGLRLSPVAAELASYFGEGSERGLLVLDADPSWQPIRAGDVVLQVSGAPATAEALRAAHASSRPTVITILRRRRTMMMTLHPRESGTADSDS